MEGDKVMLGEYPPIPPPPPPPLLRKTLQVAATIKKKSRSFDVRAKLSVSTQCIFSLIPITINMNYIKETAIKQMWTNCTSHFIETNTLFSQIPNPRIWSDLHISAKWELKRMFYTSKWKLAHQESKTIQFLKIGHLLFMLCSFNERAFSIHLLWFFLCYQTKGGFPLMAEITRILAGNICRQFFFVITTTASTRCLVKKFHLICYSQRVNAHHNTTTVVVQDVRNGRTIGWLQWWNIVVSLYKEEEAAEKDD